MNMNKTIGFMWYYFIKTYYVYEQFYDMINDMVLQVFKRTFSVRSQHANHIGLKQTW